MIIVLFHALYLLGKYVYENFHAGKRKTEEGTPKDASEKLHREAVPAATRHGDQENKKNLRFFPPVYLQRYCAVQEVIASYQYQGKLRKVVDFGCSELTFTRYLKTTTGVQEILCVDVDRATLENHKQKAAPLHADYLSVRTEPLVIHVYEGSVTHNDTKLGGCDAVICIELIEHLYEDTLMDFPYNVFGYIKPQVAIITTPNADFNVLFPNPTGFRHYDHKFEWSRQQFEDWANNIIARYPDYQVTFHGIGNGPSGTEHLGSCSQMAVFHRISQLAEEEPIEGVDGLFKTVASHEYPFSIDNRSDEEKILDEAVHYIRLFSMRNEEMSEEVPLEKLMRSVKKFYISVATLRHILEEANWAIIDRDTGPAVQVPQYSTFSSNSDVDFVDFLDNDHQQRGDEWEDLEPGVPSDYIFELEEENWDEDHPNAPHSTNSNIDVGERVPSSNLNPPGNADRNLDDYRSVDNFDSRDSLETLEDLPNDTFHNFNIENELPSNSVSIRLDHLDIDELDISYNSSFTSELVSSGSFPLSSFVDTSQSLRPETSEETFRNEGDLSIESTLTSYQSIMPPLQERNTDDGNAVFLNNNSTEIECIQTVLKNKFGSGEQQNPTEYLTEGAESNGVEVSNGFNPPTVSEGRLFPFQTKVPTLHSPSDSSLRLLFPSVLLNSQLSDNLGSDSTQNDVQTLSTDETSILLSHEITKTTHNNYPVLKSLGHENSGNLEKRVDNTLGQDSMSMRSISGCSLNIQPQYTSSPQVSMESHEEKSKDVDMRQRSVEGSQPSEKREESSTQQTLLQNPHTHGNLLESTSQSSLHSSSGMSISTVTSTSSSNVDKWYLAETNPMYRRELVVLKGGNDTADKPNDETNSDSDVPISDSHADDDKPLTKGIRGSKVTSSNCKIIKSNQQKTNLNDESTDDDSHTVKSQKQKSGEAAVKQKDFSDTVRSNSDTVELRLDNLTKDKFNEKLAQELFTKKKYTEKFKERASVESNHPTQDRQPSDNLILDKRNFELVKEETRDTQSQSKILSQTVSKSEDTYERGKLLPESDEHNMLACCTESIASFESLTQRVDAIQKTVSSLDSNAVVKDLQIVWDSIDGIPTSSKEDNLNTKSVDHYLLESAKKLAESSRKISDSVEETRNKLKSILEATKKMADVIPTPSNQPELCTKDKKLKAILEAARKLAETVDAHQVFSERNKDSNQLKALFEEAEKSIEEYDVKKSSDLNETENTPPIQTSNTNSEERDQLKSVLETALKLSLGEDISTSESLSTNVRGSSHLTYLLDSAKTSIENVQHKTVSPTGTPETPPNSWSPEIMDSGYPNSASVHDMTPENDLSSIANDRISDPESPSVAEPPRQGFFELLEVENGDLANNNRDGEGNNMIAIEVNDLDDLQPLIDVLENDLENENDIYVLQNGFPLWLLRILEMANPIDIEGVGGNQHMYALPPPEQAGGDAPNANADNDEGFDSSSSEDDSDVEDDEEEADDVTTVSSDDTEDMSEENLRRDWRAGGDP